MGKMVRSVDLQELLTKLYTSGENKLVWITTVTVPTMRKTDNPYFGRVTKKSKCKVFTNFDYEKAVNNKREKVGIEPTFESKPRKWGVRLNGTPLVSHVKKGADEVTFYLETRVSKTMPPIYYLDDWAIDDPMTLAAVKSYMPDHNSNAEWQGLLESDEIIIRDFALSSIKSISIDGEVLEVEV